MHDAGATLWAVSVRGTAQTTPSREDVLNKVTKANGGMRFSSVDASGLDAIMKNVAATLTSQYIVTFDASRRGLGEGDDLRDGRRLEGPADAIHAVMPCRAPATSSAARRAA